MLIVGKRLPVKKILGGHFSVVIFPNDIFPMINNAYICCIYPRLHGDIVYLIVQVVDCFITLVLYFQGHVQLG